MGEQGGEAACYLYRVDDAGTILAPSERVWAGAGAEGATRVDISTDPFTNALAPGQDESVEDYRARLCNVRERTAAWRLALRALESPLVLVGGSGVHGEHLEALAEYVQTLIADD
jgi:thiamine pyrophosphate-dependent acetolactate synthase large subunit-like protein